MPEGLFNALMRGGFSRRRSGLGAPFLNDDLLGANGAVAPAEAGLEARGHGEIVADGSGGLDVEDALVDFVQLAGSWLDPADIHAGKDLQEGFDDVVEIGGEHLELIARGDHFRRLNTRGEAGKRGRGAAMQLGEVVVKKDEVADERTVEDFEQKTVLVATQLVVEGVKEFLIHAIAVLEVLVEGADETRQGGDVRLRRHGFLDAHDGHGVLGNSAPKRLDVLDKRAKEIEQRGLCAPGGAVHVEVLLGLFGKRTHLQIEIGFAGTLESHAVFVSENWATED